MELKLDTRGTRWIAAAAAEPLLDFETGQRRLDRDGQPLSVVRVVAFAGDGAEVMRVKVAGDVPDVASGTALEIDGLVATTWEMGGRHGVSFRAAAVRVAGSERGTTKQ